MSPFHYAFKVKDIASTRAFYIDLLGCEEGRSTETWIDFNFYGHQLSAHISDNIAPLDYCGKVENISVPMPHFGCLLTPEQFENVKNNLIKSDVTFIIQPQIRYKEKTGEQWTMFVLDYSNNPIEFKCFTNEDEIFL